MLRPDRPTVRREFRHLFPYVLLGAGLLELPWLVVLANQLPPATEVHHWVAAWVGLDAVEAVGLIVTGFLYRWRDPRAALTGVATATLLVVDAWFDVATSNGHDQHVAIAMAAAIELPLAVLCLYAVRNRWHQPS